MYYRLIAAAISCLLCLVPNAAAPQAVFCSKIIEVSSSGGLAGMPDNLIENGTCMASREAVSAISKGDSAAEQLCVEATRRMMKEFARRFPGRDPSSVAGRC